MLRSRADNLRRRVARAAILAGMGALAALAEPASAEAFTFSSIDSPGGFARADNRAAVHRPERGSGASAGASAAAFASPLRTVCATIAAAAMAVPEPQSMKPRPKEPAPAPAAPKPRESQPREPEQGKPPPKGSKDSADEPDVIWSLVVATFTDDDHAQAAQRMIAETARIAPQVQGLRVHTTPKGSMVVYGHYAGREDPAARRDVDWLKSITYQQRQVFARVIVTHLDLRLQKGELHPYDLLSARRKHPKVNPLYTLDVAMWDDFDSGQLTYAEIRRKAEAYAMQLRQLGHEAYFYHDDVNERSMVTVGLFDRTSINPRSGLYASNVTDVIKKFPQRLVNGEPMFEYADPYSNKRAKDKDKIRMKPQTPVLVLVPSL